MFKRFMPAVVFALALAAVALAQRVEDYRNAGIQPLLTEYRAIIITLADGGVVNDGGATIESCAYAVSGDGGFRKEGCTAAYVGRTAAQRNALASCLDNGERVWALHYGIRNDAGF